MGIIGRLLKTKIETYIINTVEKRFNYNVKGESYAPPGIDAVGIKDDRQYLADIDGKGRVVILGNLMISQGAKEGEIIIYSRDTNGNLKAKIYIKNDGGIEAVGNGADVKINTNTNVVLQNGTDYACRYNELKTQLDSLKDTLDDFITNQHNNSVVPHTHTFNYNAGPNPSSGTTNTSTITSGTTSTADFSNVKVDNINVPAVGE